MDLEVPEIHYRDLFSCVPYCDPKKLPGKRSLSSYGAARLRFVRTGKEEHKAAMLNLVTHEDPPLVGRYVIEDYPSPVAQELKIIPQVIKRRDHIARSNRVWERDYHETPSPKRIAHGIPFIIPVISVLLLWALLVMCGCLLMGVWVP